MRSKALLLISLISILSLSCIRAERYQSTSDITCQQIKQLAGSAVIDFGKWQIENTFNLLSRTDSYHEGIPEAATLERQITEVLKDNKIEVLPRVRLRLERPPYLLVVSPRNIISYYCRVLLSPELTLAQIENIENKIDNLGFSSLVVELGGFGAAYPAIVSTNMNNKHIIRAAVEEWAHQFLAFRPLGFLYLLDCMGFQQSQDILIMNETLAGMIADEIGDQVYKRYYNPGKSDLRSDDKGDDEFYREMRNTRHVVDILLGEGAIETAERYMEQQRLYFVQKGYNIRKLNQAYFAFHGIYGEDPACTSPIYEDLHRLRQKYDTLASFVYSASSLTSQLALQEAIRR